MSTENAAQAKDTMVHCLAAEGRLRAVACTSTALAEEARWRHDLYPTAAAALGRTLTAAALLGSSLKEHQQITVQFVGDGPLGRVLACAEPPGIVRGFVGNPHVNLPLNARGKLDVAAAIGKGELHVISQLAQAEPYRGTVPITSGEVAEDIACYLLHSEQKPSIVSLGVLVERDGHVRASGGFLVQLMPGGDEDLAGELEERALAMPAISRLVDEGAEPMAVLEQLLGPFGLKQLERRPWRYACRCSRERFASALITLGADELQSLVDEQGGAECVCHFCGEAYRFSEQELDELIQEARQPSH